MSNLKANSISPYVGLAQRAGAILYGEDIILEKIRFAKVVLIDANAPDKYKDRLKSKIKTCPTFITEDLKRALHKDNVNAVAITNDGLANAITELLR